MTLGRYCSLRRRRREELRRLVGFGNRQSSGSSNKLIFRPRVRMIVQAPPEWCKSSLDLVTGISLIHESFSSRVRTIPSIGELLSY